MSAWKLPQHQGLDLERVSGGFKGYLVQLFVLAAGQTSRNNIMHFIWESLSIFEVGEHQTVFKGGMIHSQVIVVLLGWTTQC